MSRRAQNTGMFLIVGAALEMLLFVYGVLRRSYMALALPVTMAMAAVTVLTIWLGWTMLTMPEEEEEAPPPPVV
jgi:hypothetical protein